MHDSLIDRSMIECVLSERYVVIALLGRAAKQQHYVKRCISLNYRDTGNWTSDSESAVNFTSDTYIHHTKHIDCAVLDVLTQRGASHLSETHSSEIVS